MLARNYLLNRVTKLMISDSISSINYILIVIYQLYNYTEEMIKCTLCGTDWQESFCRTDIYVDLAAGSGQQICSCAYV